MRNFILILLFLGLAAGALAQNRHHGGHGGHGGHGQGRERLTALADSLDLSPTQRADFDRLTRQLRTDLLALREGGQRDERSRAAAKDLMQGYQADVKALLTPAQTLRLGELRSARKADRADGSQRRDSMRTALRERQAELRPMYEELSELRRDKVRATMAALRTDFDKELTEGERADIEALRKAMRAQRNAMRGQYKGFAGAGDKDAARAAIKEAREKFATEHSAEIERVRQIAERHETDLLAVRAQLKEAEASWAAEADAIRAKYLSADELARRRERHDRHDRHGHHERGAGHGGGDHRGHRGHGPEKSGARHGDERNAESKAGDGHQHREERGAMRFLLMTPGEPTANVAGLDDTDLGESFGESRINVYPNPATSATTVDFDVRADGPVRVELIDASGRVLRVLLDERRETGSARLSVDLPANAGSTLLRITDVKGVRTQVVAKAD